MPKQLVAPKVKGRSWETVVYRTLVVVAVCGLLGGCAAYVTHEPETATSTGIRYYENSPYLIVYSDGKGGLRWQIRYLPDQSRVMTVSPTIAGGRTEMTLHFQNGVLSTMNVVGDSTELPKAVIAAVQSAMPLLAAAGPKVDGFPAPYLYKIVVSGETLTFVGGQGDSAIQVPINP
jgi:hypothetical protein